MEYLGEYFRYQAQIYITLLSELVNRKQVEIIGGGFYEPIFPLIMPIDRVGQIEMNTTHIRKLIGKKPRGIFLGDTVWDPSLISSFKTCGLEFAILHHSLLPANEPEGKNLIVEDMGKTLTIIPYQKPIEDFQNLPDSQKILEKIKKLSKNIKIFEKGIAFFFNLWYNIRVCDNTRGAVLCMLGMNALTSLL